MNPDEDPEQFIDKWLTLVDNARDEVLQDKKFWAFLNGYLNLKMSQVLQNQISIIESAIQMFIGKVVKVQMNKAVNKEKELDMSIGSFITEIEQDKKLLFDFAMFLAQEMLEETQRLRKNTEMDGIEEEKVADSQL